MDSSAASIPAASSPVPLTPRSFGDLLALLDSPASCTPLPCGEAAESAAIANEDVDDPHRLATINLSRYHDAYSSDGHPGRTIKLWRDAWYVWKRGCYHKISHGELAAKITRAIKAEFDHQNIIDQLASEDPDKIKTRKVTVQLVSHVINATASLIHNGTGPVCLPYEIEPNTWLPTRSRERYISLQNGLLDLDAVLADKPESEAILPPSPNWFSMVTLDYGFNSSATCPKFMEFLDFNLEGDPERIAVARQWAGYLLMPSTDEQKFMILEGDGGNGKSVYIAVLSAMLGPANVSNIALENFGDRFQRTDTIGKLLNACGDCGEIDKSALGLLKSFISGDRMFFDRKGVEGMNCPPTARLLIACNNRPNLNDNSDGIWRRMLVMPWNVKVPEDRRVKGMDKISWWQASGELPGIFNWALKGLAELTEKGGFTRSSEMDRVVSSYRIEMNPARSFLEEECRAASDDRLIEFARCKKVYQAYTEWCKSHGHHYPISDMRFGKEVKRLFPQSRRLRENKGERLWYYEGIHLLPPKTKESDEDPPELVNGQSTF